MNRQENLRREMLVRVQDFGAAHSELFPAGSFGAQLFAEIAEVVAELNHIAATQSSSASTSRLSTTSRAVARATLHDTLEAISLCAQAMSLTMPGLEDQFRLPRSNNDWKLLDAARAFARDAVPLKAEFIRREMPADFLERLNAQIAQFEAMISKRNRSTASQVAATATIDNLIDRGMRAVKEFNVVVRNKLEDDRAALAAWTSASHVERHSSRKSGSKTTDTDPADSGPHGPVVPGVPTTSSGQTPAS